MSDYTYKLIEPNGTEHPLDDENVVDLICAVDLHNEIRNMINEEAKKGRTLTKSGRNYTKWFKRRVQEKLFDIALDSHLGEALPDTKEKIKKIQTLGTAY